MDKTLLENIVIKQNVTKQIEIGENVDDCNSFTHIRYPDV